METKRIFELIDERRDELFELLGSFVKINTENRGNGGNEKNIVPLLEKICKELSLETDVYSPMSLEGFENHPDYIQNHALEERYNVTARYKGVEDRDDLMLMAHTDTVLIGDEANWDVDPLLGEIVNGEIVGRGACDDKYGLATILFIFKLLKEEGFVPKANMLFSGYVDEEYGGSHGAMATVMKYPCPRIVSMDGREDQIWHCGSGGGEMAYVYHTADPVSSAKNAALALPIVLEIIEKEFADKRRAELAENPYYKGTNIPDTALRYMHVHAGDHGHDLGVGDVYFVFYTDKTKDEIYAEFDRIHNIIKERLAPLGIIGDGFEARTRFFHYVHCEPDSDDVLDMLAASREATGKEPLVCGSCLSDLSVISKYGSSRAFAFGAGKEFSKRGGPHQPNESIECDKLVDYAKTIAAYILRTLG